MATDQCSAELVTTIHASTTDYYPWLIGYCLIIIIIMMCLVQDKSQSTVRTRLRSTLVQVDVYLGMAQSTTTSITGHLQHDRWKTIR